MAINDAQIVDIATTILDATGLEHIDMSELTNESMLGEAPLELDSIDILEAVAAIEDKYKVHIVDAKEGAKYFKSLQTISDFINSKK